MYFYLSFLRPPQTQVAPTEPVVFTVQVTNDLRTEVYPLEIDIFYLWLPVATQHTAQVAQHHQARPTKLLRWTPKHMYKPISLNIPPDFGRIANQWRLLLTASNSIKLGDAELSGVALSSGLKIPISVQSMPIHLRSSDRNSYNASSSQKQHEIERAFSIPHVQSTSTINPKELSIVIRERTSFDLDKKIWDSGVGLCSYLVDLVLKDGSCTLHPAAARLRNLCLNHGQEAIKVIELGTGTGIVSIVLGKILSMVTPTRSCWIYATDLPSALDLIHHNVEKNKDKPTNARVVPLALDWEDGPLPTVICDFASSSEKKAMFDLIVMADVAYNTNSFPFLVSTIVKLLSDTTIVIMAYKQRDEDERRLWPMLEDRGVHPQLISRLDGSGEPGVEI